MRRTVTLIKGDGIGPEVVNSVIRIFEAAEVPIDWEEHDAGIVSLDKGDELIPDQLIESIERNKIALKGPITTPLAGGFKSVNITLRQHFDLYANVRPSNSVEGINTRFTGVDLIVFRENTEGLYSGLELWDEANQIADSIARVTRKGSEDIIRFAFEYMKEKGRKKLTVVHKANILKKTTGLFLNIAREMSKEYPSIEFEDKIIDNMSMQLVSKPEQFDCIVTTNLFGDILSDLCAGLVGGLGIVPGANIGKNHAVFEAVHGSAPDIAGKGLANPTALLRSAIMMLDHIGEIEKARVISEALYLTLKNPKTKTKDLGGELNTAEFTNKIIDNLKNVS